MIERTPKEELKFSSLFQYASLALPMGFSGLPIYLLAPDFYAINYGIALSALGTALLFIRAFDAIQDPLIGIISDRYRQHTLAFVAVSCLILALSIYGLFNASLFSPLIRFIICMTAAATAYSVVTINLNSAGGLWFSQEKHQIKISSVRECFALMGFLLAVSIPNFLEGRVAKDTVYQWFALALFALILVGFIQFYNWYRAHSKQFHYKAPASLFRFNKFSSESKKFFGIYCASMFASSIPAVLVIFFVRDLLDAKHYTGLFFLLYFMSAAIFIPFWHHVSKKKGQYKAWFFSMLLASASFIWAFFLTKGDVWQYGLICVISGFALGGDLVFPPSILADHIHAGKSQENASAYYGILNLLSKASLAFASALSFFILDSVQFKAGGDNLSVSLLGLSVAYALVPSILKIGAAFILWNFFIKPKRLNFHENN
jgi:GPH family glycoside/pentoside/hexuronide:cation symporter